MQHYNMTIDVERLYSDPVGITIKMGNKECSKFLGDDAKLILHIITGGMDPGQIAREQASKLESLYKEAAKNFRNMCGSEEDKKKEMYDFVSAPSHYLSGRQYEPRKVIDDWELGFYLGNTVKYISRAGRKGNRLEDLQKARQYLDWEIEKEEMKNDSAEHL